MELYNETNVKLIVEKLDDIINIIEEKKLENFEPTREELMNVNKIVLDFIREKKRKIYGGYAQNKAIIQKNPNDAFYKETKIPDIDYYSPDPLNDLKDLSDQLHQKGFKHVDAQEALHKETYSIFVNFSPIPVCDISYVPKNIYNRIPFIEIEGINYVNPSFMMIDMLRILTDPYFSSFRWEKIVPRINTLQKYYPFNKASKPLPDSYKVPSDKKEVLNRLNWFVYDEIKNKDKFILFGQAAYNYFLGESEILRDNKLGKKYRYLDNNLIEIISTNYLNDGSKMIDSIKMKFKDISEKITYIEYYPFWMFIGYSVMVFYEDIPFLNIVFHNRRCLPIRKTPLRNFTNAPFPILPDDFIMLGSFDVVLMMSLITGFKMRVNFEEDKSHFYNIMTSHLIEMRNHFLNKKGLTPLDDSLFQEFISTCIGSAVDPVREARLERNKKRTEGKKIIYRYTPGSNKPIPIFRFSNSSGNPIRKVRNLKLMKVFKPEDGSQLINHDDLNELEDLEDENE